MENQPAVSSSSCCEPAGASSGDGAKRNTPNPLDVAISYSHHNAISIDAAIESLARRGAMTSGDATHVYEIYGSWSENVLSWTQHPNPGLHVVRYEDMLGRAPHPDPSRRRRHSSSASTCRRAAWSKRAIKLSSFKVLQGAGAAAIGFVERPARMPRRFFREGQGGQWRHAV